MTTKETFQLIGWATLIISIVCMIIGALLMRAEKVKDFRDSWRKQLQNSPEGLSAFHNMMPSFNKMLWQFWKPIKDSVWVPPAIRAEKAMSELDPDTRKKVVEWARKGGKV